MLIAGARAGAGGDTSVQPGGSIICRIPGGGGLGDPIERDRELVRRDLAFGYISAGHAEQAYGYFAEQDAATKKEVA
jgi:N-methylhydantoinase B/oxoprolinase/acetone carboxylase alpha subunit